METILSHLEISVRALQATMRQQYSVYVSKQKM